MKIILVRHTKIDIPEGMCYGQLDVDVKSSFPEESDLIVSEFKKQIYHKIYSSPLQRCKKLAEKISEPAKINYDKRLMEFSFGEWEGKYWEDIGKEAKNVFENYDLNNHCPGGESFKDLIDRIQSFLNELLKENSSKSILIVTHGGPIRAFLSLIEKIPPLQTFERKIDYGEIVILKLHNDSNNS